MLDPAVGILPRFDDAAACKYNTNFATIQQDPVYLKTYVLQFDIEESHVLQFASTAIDVWKLRPDFVRNRGRMAWSLYMAGRRIALNCSSVITNRNLSALPVLSFF